LAVASAWLAGCAAVPTPPPVVPAPAPANGASATAAPMPDPAVVAGPVRPVVAPSPPPAIPASPPAGAPAPGASPAQPPTPAPTPAPAPPGATAASPPGAAPRPPGSAAAPPAPPVSATPFASVIKDARRIEGVLPMWQREERVWIELSPSAFNRPFLLSPKIRTGIGESWVLGGLMALPVGGAGGPQVVEFQRVHNQVRLVAPNLDVFAKAGTPEARAVAASYSSSILGAVSVASAPHPDSKAVLIEANPLFLGDMLGVGMMLQRAFRQGYAFDARNSLVTAVRGGPNLAVIETQAHYYTGGIAALLPGAPPGTPPPGVPRFVPDSRSLLVGLHYSLMPLPEVPKPRRAADPRVGHFTNAVLDFSDDFARSPRTRMIARWRLEKQQPEAALSPPVKPITFWIDRNVPLAYRDTVREAILEWNKAFERIGFQDAIVVQQQPDDAEWDTLDADRASVRWMMNAAPQFDAIGPSHIDPRSGEILDADIAIEGLPMRVRRAERAQVIAPEAFSAAPAALLPAPAAGHARPMTPFTPPIALPWLEAARAGAQPAEAGGAAGGAVHVHGALCRHGELAAEQIAYALDVLDARGELDPEGPEAQRFVLAYLKDTVMHEVGHALGLRHNFRASRVYTQAQLDDPAFTRAHGTTGSVMEYTPINLARPGQAGGAPFNGTLGPYDHWAIEYAYKPLPAGTSPEAEREELRRIAARSSEPLLAYGSDEDSWLGLDPETIQLDLGADPVAFAEARLDIARDLLKRQESRPLPPERDYAVLRRSVNFAFADVVRATGVLVRQIGAVRTLRDFPGSGRDPLQPLDAGTQRRAIGLITEHLLGADALVISPSLQRRLAPDYLERIEAGQPTDYALPGRLLDLQRAVLGYLMSDLVATRLLDNVAKHDRPREAFALAELYARLDAEVWSELGRGGVIAPGRRELQRDHLNRIAYGLLRVSPAARTDARALLRENAASLLARLDKAARRSGADAATRAHLRDSANSLRETLAAKLPRLGV
jgi:hypothetical protein